MDCDETPKNNGTTKIRKIKIKKGGKQKLGETKKNRF